MAQDTFVVAPTLLVKMFGVPESVRVPRKLGEETTFIAYSIRFHLKKLASDTWCLSCPLHSPRCRFGNRAEIIEDVGKVLETGALPKSVNAVA
jgi:hypothetical protein